MLITRKITCTWLGNMLGSIFQIRTLRVSLSFFHPSSTKLQNLTCKAHSDHADQNFLNMLQEILQSCETFQMLSNKPKSFKIANLEDINFNSEIALFFWNLYNRPVLHVVDLKTNFSSTFFLAGESLGCLRCLYTLLVIYLYWLSWCNDSQRRINTHHPKTWCEGWFPIIFELNSQELKFIILWVLENHGPLRGTYHKILHSYSIFPASIEPALSVKLWTTLWSKTFLSLFYVYLELFVTSHSLTHLSLLSANKEIIHVLCMAQREMKTIVCQLRLNKSLSSHFPLGSNHIFPVEDEVLVNREWENRIRLGPTSWSELKTNKLLKTGMKRLFYMYSESSFRM